MENVEFTSDILLHLRLLKLGAGNYKLTLIWSFQDGMPAISNTKAYMERRGKQIKVFIDNDFLINYFFKLRFPRGLMPSQWQSRDN